MGLPLFITPMEPDTALRAVDKTAAVPRSAIRRHRVRPMSRADESLRRIASEERRRRMLEGLTNPAGEQDYIERPRESVSQELVSTNASHSRAMRRMLDFERSRLRENVSFERVSGPDIEIDGPLMPPVPETRDYAGIEHDRGDTRRLEHVIQDLRSMARRHPAPTPPYQAGEEEARSSMGTWEQENEALIRSLPPLQPARDNNVSSRRSSGHSDLTYTTRRTPPIDQHDSSQDARQSNVGVSALSQRVRALNHVSNNLERSRRLIRQARMDGLGDRERSLSPEGGAVWDTLLTSITPDPQPPSAGSSFASASAAAAASSSTSSGSRSAATSMTSPERSDGHASDQDAGDSTSRYVIDCISDSGSNTEDENEELYELGGLGRDRRPRLRSYAEVATPREDDHDSIGRRTTSATEDLGGWQRIIRRLTERDDIPESWWQEAGLIRDIRREP